MSKAKMRKMAKIQRQQTIDMAEMFKPMIADCEKTVEHLRLFVEDGPNLPGANEARASFQNLESGFLGLARAYINAAENYKVEDAEEAKNNTNKSTGRTKKGSE